MNGYRRANRIGLACSAAAWLALASLSVTPDGRGLSTPGGFRLPELCWSLRTSGAECPSCHLGRSLVLALQGNLGASTGQHPGGLWLAGWLVLHTLARAGLALIAVAPKKWPLDLGATLGSFLACLLVVIAVC